MTDHITIRPGDVVIDLTQNAKMQVLTQTATSVSEYNDREDFDLTTYKVHPQLRVSPDEPVYTCVYLQGELAVPGGTYDFPESRLARMPVELANESLVRVQDEVVVSVVQELLSAYDAVEDEGVHRLETAIVDVLGESVAELVFELVDVDERFTEATR